MGKYLVNRRFILGAFGVSLETGQTVEFDGTTLTVGTTPYACPQFSAAIRETWATLVSGDPITPPTAPSPIVKVQPQSKPKKVVNGFEINEEGSQTVNTVSSIVEKRQQIAKTAASALSKPPPSVPAPLAKKMPLVSENQESTTIAKIRPPRVDGKGQVTDEARIEWVGKPPTKKVAAPVIEEPEPEGDIDLGWDDTPELQVEANTPQVPDRITQVVQAWDKKAHYQFRVKEAVETHGQDPEVLEAIFAIESPGVVSMIKKKLNR